MVEHLLRNLPTVARAILAHQLQAMGIEPAKEARALIDIIQPSGRTENRTHAFREVKKCGSPQRPQSQEVNKAKASSHRIAANV